MSDHFIKEPYEASQNSLFVDLPSHAFLFGPLQALQV